MAARGAPNLERPAEEGGHFAVGVEELSQREAAGAVGVVHGARELHTRVVLRLHPRASTQQQPRTSHDAHRHVGIQGPTGGHTRTPKHTNTHISRSKWQIEAGEGRMRTCMGTNQSHDASCSDSSVTSRRTRSH